MKLCQAGRYNDSIVIAQKQLNYYRRALKNRNTKTAIEMIHIHLAISYFGLSNDEQFVHNISQVNEVNPEKHFWLALFYLTNHEFAKFQTQYEILESLHVSDNYLAYLSSIKKILECDDADARTTLLMLKPKFNFKLLQDISQQIINQ